MTQQYHLDNALLPQGWVRDARVHVATNGVISAIETLPPNRIETSAASHHSGSDAAAAIEHIHGFVIPGMPNAHSHAFQRGMAGHTEYRLSAHDSFWTWRQAMYALANRIEPDDLRTLATQLFIEMLKAGYTSVAEFHYLHRQPDGTHYPQGQGLWDAVTAAADTAGIGLTLLPTLYQTGDFGGKPLKADQSRFALDTEWFLRAVERRVESERDSPSNLLRTGVAFHSLRAVPLATLETATVELRRIDASMPLHIHVAEQLKEVESCRQQTGRRPIELLLDAGLLNRHWCLVHATHATAAELQGIASSGAAVCVSISTEANLGDGFFDAAGFLRRHGRLCVGSDSQATVCPAEELRWMEYQQRLRKRRRGVLADKLESHVGTRLWGEAARSGAEAIGQATGSIAVGKRADWLVLDADHPSMAGAAAANAIDHLMFAGARAAIRDVLVGGRWVVKQGRHAADSRPSGEFQRLMQRLGRSDGHDPTTP